MDARVKRRRKQLVSIPEEVHFSLLSKVKPSCFKKAGTNECWIKEIEEELNHIEKS